MKNALFFFMPIVLAAALPLSADTIVCTDGRTLDGVITARNGAQVTINVGGAEVTVPRGEIKSITTSSARSDERLEEGWKKLDERYKEESREAAAEAAAAPEPTSPPPPPPPPAEPAGSGAPAEEQIVFPAEPPASGGGFPSSGEEQPRLRREQDVRKAIDEKRVIPGMTPDQVQRAWGFPFSTAPVDNVDTHTDRWTYHRDDGRHYVFFTNGRVVSVTAW